LLCQNKSENKKEGETANHERQAGIKVREFFLYFIKAAAALVRCEMLQEVGWDARIRKREEREDMKILK
jgi:hypothetical protein